MRSLEPIRKNTRSVVPYAAGASRPLHCAVQWFEQDALVALGTTGKLLDELFRIVSYFVIKTCPVTRVVLPLLIFSKGISIAYLLLV